MSDGRTKLRFEPAQLVLADLDGMGIVWARIAAIRVVAEQLERGERYGHGHGNFVPAICKIKGVGNGLRSI